MLLATDPNELKKGAARSLINSLRSIAGEKGITKIIAKVSLDAKLACLSRNFMKID